MFEISEQLDKKLKELPFLDYLKYMHSRIEGLRHTPKSDRAYTEAKELSRHVITRYVQEYGLTWDDYDKKSPGRNLRLSESILDKYNTRASDSAKSDVIRDFVNDFSYDLSSMIRARERHKENPDTPIEDEPI